MAPLRCAIVLILQILICDLVGSLHHLHQDKEWTHTRRVRHCFTSRGKRGICLPATVCGKHSSNGGSNDIFGYHCKNVNGNPMVCCFNKWRQFHARTINSGSYDLLSIPLVASLRGIASSNSIPVPTSASASSANLTSLPISSPGSLKDTGPSNVLRLLSNVSSIAIHEPVPNSSVASVRRRRSFSSERSLLSLSTAIPDSVLITSEVSVSELPSLVPTTANPEFSTNSTTPKVSSPEIVEDDFASAFPEPPVCGVSRGVFSRVVGGVDAHLGDFPWLGVVAYRSPGGVVFKCGASLITSQHSLTAAHCIVGVEDRLYFVRLGELDLADHNQTRPVDAVVKRMIIHEKYSVKNGTNDIGLLIFYRKVIFTNIIRPICLPLSEELRTKNFVGYHPFVAGWGHTSYQGQAPTRLQMLQLPVVSEDSCSMAYKDFKTLVVDERVICAGGSVGSDACNGDSGGPLMQSIWDPTNYTTYFYQTGIVSFGMKCGTRGFPGVYTRVTEYIPWIQKHVLGTNSS